MLEQVKELRDRTGAGMVDCKKALEETNGDIDKAIIILREKGTVKAEKKQSRIAAEGLATTIIEDNKAVILEVNSETDFVAKNDKFVSLVDNILHALLKNEPKDLEEALTLGVEGDTVEGSITNLTATIGEKISFRRFDILDIKEDEEVYSYIHGGGKIAALVKLKGGDEELGIDLAMQIAAMNPLYLTSEDVPADKIEVEKDLARKEAIEQGKPENILDKLVDGRIRKYFEEVCLIEQTFIKDNKKQIKDILKENNAELVTYIRYEVGEGMEKRCDNFHEEVMSQING